MNHLQLPVNRIIWKIFSIAITNIGIVRYLKYNLYFNTIILLNLLVFYSLYILVWIIIMHQWRFYAIQGDRNNLIVFSLCLHL